MCRFVCVCVHCFFKQPEGGVGKKRFPELHIFSTVAKVGGIMWEHPRLWKYESA